LGRLILLLCVAFLGAASLVGAAEAPLQLLVSIAPDTGATKGVLTAWERKAPSAPWLPAPAVFAGQPSTVVQYGWKGLAWGRGLHAPQSGLQKMDGDGRAPMGRFAIGTMFGDAPQLPPGAKWTDYVQKTDRTAWIDDPTLPGYNHLYVLRDGETPPPWFERNRMRTGDPARAWEILIEHNYTDAQPGFGSAIFFHIRRAVDHPSAGCTVMAEDALLGLMTWLDPQAHPQLVQLDRDDYARLGKEWELPAPAK
jgi:hypothetical protein